MNRHYDFNKLLLSVACIAAIFSFACAVPVSAIIITSNDVRADALDYSSFTFAEDIFSGTTIPSSGSLDTTFNADFYSRMAINYKGSGNQVTLSNTFDQLRTGDYGDYVRSITSTFFTADADVTYAVSGMYIVLDADGSAPGNVSFYSRLYDATDGVFLFDTQQYSQSTSNESFVMGLTEGDSINSLTGSLTGNLLQGHTYQWIWGAVTQIYSDEDGGASATGFIQLDIGGGAPSSVPDGGTTLALMALALLVLVPFASMTRLSPARG